MTMSGDTMWLLLVAVAFAAAGAIIVWRGYFEMPFYGRIDRADDPGSVWVIAIFCWGLSVVLALFALA